MSFTLSDKMAEYIWVNGEFVPWDEAQIHVMTHSLHYSGGVFEGERAYQGNVFKLSEHTQRLLKSAEYMHLKIKYSANEINEATEQLLIKNNIRDAYIRPFAWRGAGTIGLYNKGLSTNLMIAAYPSNPQFANNLRLNIGNWKKPHPESIPPQSKSSAHYAMGIVLKGSAIEAGYDDSLILDLYGNIAECTVSNIFFGNKEGLFTPIADRFLNGITRQSVIEMARNMGVKVNEVRLTLEDISQYNICFLTGSAIEISGVCAIDLENKQLTFPDQENLVAKLQKEFAKITNKKIQ